MEKEKEDFSKILPNYQDIIYANEILKGIVKKTPLEKSETFSKIIGSNIYLKMECLQKTGSFKVRGAYVKVNSIEKEKSKYGVIAASAGNHAQGVAFAAHEHNIPCTIIMPSNASPAKVSATKSYGADVILKGSSYDEAFSFVKDISTRERKTIIHAFDDPKIIAGQGTVGLEILQELKDIDEIYIPLGGGGLAAGMAIAIKTKRPEIKIFGIESKAFPSMKRSIDKGKIVDIVSEYTIADGISVKSPGIMNFELVKRYIDDIFLVEDHQIIKTMFLLMERMKTVVEPAGAASLAYLLSERQSKPRSNIVSIISGGNVDMYLLGQVVSKGLMQTGRMIKLFIQLPDKPGALKQVVDRISELNVNIVEVIHDRLSAEISAGTAGVYLSLEMENKQHGEKLISYLKEMGLNFRLTR